MAEIGKLTAKIGLDTRTLERGVVRTRKKVRDLGRTIRVALAPLIKIIAAVQAAFALLGAAVGGVFASMTSKIDKFAKMSKAIGIPVEELSALEHVANLSGVSIEELTASMRLLSKNMADMAAGGAGPAVKALEALGIEIKDAEGNLRDTQAVMGDVANKFSQLRDDTSKTALAMSIFGESGAKLIPLLNSGAAGIKEMKEEAARLGIVIDKRTAKATENFNDNVARLKAVFSGVAQQIFKNVLPAMLKVSENWLKGAKDSKTLQAAVEVLTFSFKSLLTGVTLVKAVFEVLGAAISSVASALLSAAQGEFTEAFETLKKGVTDVKTVMAENATLVKDIWTSTAEDVITASGSIQEKAQAPLMAMTTALQDAQIKSAEAQTRMNAAMAEGKAIFDATRTPMEALILKQKRLNELLGMGAINADTFGRAMKMASALSAQNVEMMAGQVGNALGVMFKDSKVAAIAQALINTYVGISQALRSYPPPVSTAMAAVQAAMGFAQVAAIKNTSDKTTTASSAAAPSTAAATAAAAPGPNAGQTLTVEGLDANDFISGATASRLAETLLAYQRDGGRVVL